jgi:poly(3-hydroxyalkanoate) synthetase
MDLKEGRSIVANYVKAGFDTYLIDWGTPTRAERFLTTDTMSTATCLMSSNICGKGMAQIR